jgi:ribose transport system substrate-binding protein
MTGGQALERLIEEKEGTVIILGHDDETWIGGYDRTQGAKKVLETAGYTVVIRQVDWADPDADMEFLESALQDADPPAVGMLGLFSNAYLCADAAESAGMSEDLKIVAFDFDPQTISYMKQGIIDATLAQRQYYMGYLLPYILFSAKVLGLEETKELFSSIIYENELIYTGLDLVQNDQLEEYNSFLNSLGIF